MIDVNLIKFNEIVNKIKNKNIICFGAGTTAEFLISLLPEDTKIKYFIDNDKRIHGKVIQGVEIKAPETIKNENPNESVILLNNKYFSDNIKQLEEMEYRGKYFNVYQYIGEIGFINQKNQIKDKLINFIENIPKETLSNSNKQNVVIVINPTCVYNLMWYNLAIAMLLRYEGHNITIVANWMENIDDIIKSKSLMQQAREHLKEVLQYLSVKFTDIEIGHIDMDKQLEISGDELDEIMYHARYLTDWQMSRRDLNICDYNKEQIQDILLKTLLEDYKSSSAYFVNHSKFDCAVSHTGIIKYNIIHTLMGKKYGFRVAAYDHCGIKDRTNMTAVAPAGHLKDIRRVIEKNMFNQEEYLAIIKHSKNKFLNKYKSIQKSNIRCDVVIPLNVMWDVAVLGIDRVFDNSKQWLFETINYILNNTQGIVAITEHPVGVSLKALYNTENYTEFIKKSFGENDRIKIFNCDSGISSFALIKNAKIVLPFSSTIGIESILLDKAVITHTNVYYDELKLSLSAKSKEEYFYLIKKYLIEDFIDRKITKDRVWIAYYLYHCLFVKTDFVESSIEFLESDIHELYKSKGVDLILNAIIKDEIPYYYNALEELFKDID